MMYFCVQYLTLIDMLKSKSFLFILTVFISLTLLFSCKKDNPAVSGTQWTVDDITFSADKNGGFFFQNDTAAIFGANTKSKDAVLLLFKSKPAEGVYSVVNFQKKSKPSLLEDNECIILVTNKSSKIAYFSLREDVGKINISNSGKKITATFSDLNLGYIDVASGDIVDAIVSGTIIEK